MDIPSIEFVRDQLVQKYPLFWEREKNQPDFRDNLWKWCITCKAFGIYL